MPGRFAAPHRRAARVRVGERAAACECVSCTGAQVVGLHIRIGMGTCSCKCDATTNWLFLNPRKGLWQGLFRQCARGSPAILMARPALGCLCSCGLHVKCSPKTFGFASVDCIRVASGHGGSVWSAEYCQLLIASVLAAWHIWPGPRHRMVCPDRRPGSTRVLHRSRVCLRSVEVLQASEHSVSPWSFVG